MKRQIKLDTFQEISGVFAATRKKFARFMFNMNNIHVELNYFMFASKNIIGNLFRSPAKDSFVLNEQVINSLSGFTLITIVS